MSQFLFQYHAVSPSTWVYLSSLLMIGLFFKFSRLWSVRNLDLLMLILLAPGLLLIHFGQIKRSEMGVSTPPPSGPTEIRSEPTVESIESEKAGTEVEESDDVAVATVPTEVAQIELWGYSWLLGLGALWFVRMLLDTRLIRRPLLSPNLSVGGMAFIGVAIFLFLMANVVNDGRLGRRVPAGKNAESINARMEQILTFQQPERGPGYAALDLMPSSAKKVVVILSHLAIIVGIVLVAYRHFGNAANGIGAATLYLMLPYTSQMTGRVDHFLPAALLVWAVFFYRRPAISGLLVGAAFGCVYYPLFLLPLWISFYWHRGAFRFLLGVATALVALTIVLRLTQESQQFVSDVQRMFGIFLPEMENLEGLWNTRIGGWDPVFRLPILVATCVFSVSLFPWPAQKNLGTLISCSAAVMLASQFWHGFGGGLFIGWYLPLTLLMIFRPNLEDRVAQTMLSETPFSRRRAAVSV